MLAAAFHAPGGDGPQTGLQIELIPAGFAQLAWPAGEHGQQVQADTHIHRAGIQADGSEQCRQFLYGYMGEVFAGFAEQEFVQPLQGVVRRASGDPCQIVDFGAVASNAPGLFVDAFCVPARAGTPSESMGRIEMKGRWPNTGKTCSSRAPRSAGRAGGSSPCGGRCAIPGSGARRCPVRPRARLPAARVAWRPGQCRGWIRHAAEPLSCALARQSAGAGEGRSYRVPTMTTSRPASCSGAARTSGHRAGRAIQAIPVSDAVLLGFRFELGKDAFGHRPPLDLAALHSCIRQFQADGSGTRQDSS